MTHYFMIGYYQWSKREPFPFAPAQNSNTSTSANFRRTLAVLIYDRPAA